MSSEDDDELAVGDVVRRVAFDIGSGCTKCQIADVDVSTSRIISLHFGQEVPVPFSVDWKQSTDGNLSKAIQDKGLQVLNDFARKATAAGATQSAAMATEVFRKANNGAAYLERIHSELGLRVRLVTQELEAHLGFLTAAAFSTRPLDRLICWDSGGASFQITRQLCAAAPGGSPQLEAYLGVLGVGIATCACVEAVQGREYASQPSPNPVALDEARKLVTHLQAQLAAVPNWLRGSADVVAIGGRNSIFSLATDVLQRVEGSASSSFTPEQVWKCVEATVGQPDAALAELYCAYELSDPPTFVVPKLVLLYSVMDRCALPHIAFQSAVGSTAGMLVSDVMFAASAS